MRRRKYRHTWETLSILHTDDLGRWALAGYAGPIEFKTGPVPLARIEHDAEADTLRIFYSPALGAPPQQDSASIVRRHLLRNGAPPRPMFVAPCCGGVTKRLALLPDGLRCGKCGSITHQCTRDSKALVAMRSAKAIAEQLGCAAWWQEPMRRPLGMRYKTFARLKARHACYVEKARALITRGLEADLGARDSAEFLEAAGRLVMTR